MSRNTTTNADDPEKTYQETLNDAVGELQTHALNRDSEEFQRIIVALANFTHPDFEERCAYFSKRFEEDLRSNKIKMNKNVVAAIVLESGVQNRFEKHFKSTGSLKILGAMLEFNKTYDTNFFRIDEFLNDSTLRRIKKAKDLAPEPSASEEDIKNLNSTFEQVIAELESIQNIRERQKHFYKDPLKNLLNIIRKNTSQTDEESDVTQNFWESLKRIYGTRKPNAQTNQYLRPIIEILIAAVRDDDLKLFVEKEPSSITEKSHQIAGLFCPDKNFIYTSGKSLSLVAGTISHESTHLADLVISDSPLEYFSATHEKELIEILNSLVEQKEKMPPQIAQIFTHIATYPPEEWPRELVARGIQVIASYQDGLEFLQKFSPDLIKFYDETFLPRCRQYLETKLKDKPLEWISYDSDDNKSTSSSAAYQSDEEERIMLPQATEIIPETPLEIGDSQPETDEDIILPEATNIIPESPLKNRAELTEQPSARPRKIKTSPAAENSSAPKRRRR